MNYKINELDLVAKYRSFHSRENKDFFKSTHGTEIKTSLNIFEFFDEKYKPIDWRCITISSKIKHKENDA